MTRQAQNRSDPTRSGKLGLACLVAITSLPFVTGCKAAPPVQVAPAFTASPELARINPNDVAVLPVQDATPRQNATRVLATMRRALEERLVTRRYAPLAPGVVDANLAIAGGSHRDSILDAAWLADLAGSFKEDAILAVRVNRWNTATLLRDNRVQFDVEAALVGSQTGEVLWSGTLNGTVKAGGQGAAPLDPEDRVQDAAARTMQELLGYLDRRRLVSGG